MIEPGRIVDIRHRLWRIDSISGDILQATNISGGIAESRRFYLPFEKVEDATIPHPDPTILGTPQDNEMLIQAFRYSLLHGSAPLLSLQKCCIIPTYYQLVPVVMALNMANRVRMLIADDVGLGKTIEAGLITTELMSRNLASRILVICPKNLREQWRETLSRYFQLDAKIISAVHLRDLERPLPAGASPWSYYKCLITSIDYAKSSAIKNHVLEVPWDLVIVDEAHIAAKPHQTGEKQHVSMERYNFVSNIAKRTRHLLLLSATPHSGYSDSYASLLDMLDCRIVTGPVNAPQINRDIAKRHVCQRRRTDVSEWFTLNNEPNPFPCREQKSLIVEGLTEPERESMSALEAYVKTLMTAVENEKRTHIRMTAQWAVLHLHKRALSSPAALRKSLENRYSRLSALLQSKSDGDEQISMNDPVFSLTEEQAREITLEGEGYEGAGGDELSDEECSSLLDGIVFGSKEALEMELSELKKLQEFAKKITPGKDSKLRKLTAPDGYLDNAFSGYYGPKRVIIFTRYKDTLDYLVDVLPKSLRNRISADEIVTIFGELSDAERIERLDKFRNLEKGILIATDCISEGIDLQHMANQIVHYELPWNPNRLEQRNGRIDRYGQEEEKVQIRTLVMDDNLDRAILELLVKKANQIREDYGFAPPFFGDDVNVYDMLLTLDIEIPDISPQRTFDNFTQKRERIIIDPFDKETLDQIKSESFYGQADVDLSDVQKRMHTTEKEIGSTKDLELFVRHGLSKFGAVITDNSDGTIRIVLSEDQIVSGIDRVIPRATFDPNVALRSGDVEQINSGHPIVRKLIEMVKDRFFQGNSGCYGRTAVYSSSEVSGVTAVYAYLTRFVTGDSSKHVIEEIVLCGYDLLAEQCLNREDILRLHTVKLAPNWLSRDELLAHLDMALDEAICQQAFSTAVSAKMNEIAAERKALLARFKESGEDVEWLQGSDKVTLVSSDLLAVRIYEPVHGGM